MVANRTAGPMAPSPRGPMVMARGPPPPLHMRMGMGRGAEQLEHEWGQEFERHVAGKEVRGARW